eukprot:scaffold2874_cov384-Prasinococcus_capsulatus_cf.AAC.3
MDSRGRWSPLHLNQVLFECAAGLRQACNFGFQRLDKPIVVGRLVEYRPKLCLEAARLFFQHLATCCTTLKLLAQGFDLVRKACVFRGELHGHVALVGVDAFQLSLVR